MTALYNEINLYAAKWLENLIDNNYIADGVVDDRSIQELRKKDLKNIIQFHAFAGIGIWSYALKCAGWPDNEEVWTGSCPCQPFSVIGKHKGFKDERHLWPEWFRLIKEYKPTTIFGEQVASSFGRNWLSIVFSDLETLGYQVAGADLCAAGIGAPHIRQRLYFVAYSNSKRFNRFNSLLRSKDGSVGRTEYLKLPGAVKKIIFGKTQNGQSAKMPKEDRLNPEHSRWLMGIPVEWSNCAPTVIHFARRSQLNSFEQPWNIK